MLYPAKLVSFFVRARILCQQSVHDLLQSALHGFLNLPQVREQLPLSHDMFDEDAIVLKGIPGEVTLKSSKGHRGVTLMAPDFPIFGFWHMPKTDAPYICLEPWSSLPSHQDVIEDLEKQVDLISLPAMGVYQTAWSLQCF